MKKLLCNTEYKQKVSEVSLPYDGSVPKKCARFPEGVAEIRQPYKYRIILFGCVNRCNVKFENFDPNYE
jgi:hypothetical protein